MQGVTLRKTDIEGLGQLAGDVLAAGGAVVQDMHEGIAQRVFRHIPASAPVRLAHDGIAGAVYAAVRGGLRGAALAGTRLAAAGASDDGPAFDAEPRAALALAAVNGLWGHHLVARRSSLAFGMDVRRRGHSVPATAVALGAAFPDATSRIVVFVHGLCETDASWRIAPGGPQRRDRRPYGARLQDELSYTPVYLRYNTGLRISENGRGLARLLEDLMAAWPVRVEEIVLVGHSMGGLVARSACHYGERHDQRWTSLIRHVFCLGTPHLGADLEKGLNALAWLLKQLPETRALGNLLNTRSLGIKDLRYGSLVDEDWSGADPDEFLRDRCQEVPFLPDAHYYFIGTVLHPGPLGRLFGDLLVRTPSASGRGSGSRRRVAFDAGNGRQLTGVNHFELLNHPAVYEQLRAWITRPLRSRRAPAALPSPRRPVAALGA